MSSTLSTGSNTSPLLAQLNSQGFVIIRSLISGKDLETLQAGAEEITTLARAGKWPSVRTIGKQFPPWPVGLSSSELAALGGIWGIQGLMSPTIPGLPGVSVNPHASLFANLYFSSKILDIVKELLPGATHDNELVMELLNMLVAPDCAFELRWHRDDIPSQATVEQELERLSKPSWHAQYNLALYEDESLILVPGSHCRARTETERMASAFEPKLPGMLVVKLKPGDCVFYNNNILHRGVYAPREGIENGKRRMTVHGSVGHIKGGRMRARNVLQHGVGKWANECLFIELEEERREIARAMRDKLVQLGQETGELGYSHAD